MKNNKRSNVRKTTEQFIEEARQVHGDKYDYSKVEYTDSKTIEGFWSHFRRMISGCYHDVSDEHLQVYIDEAVYRWNTRKASESERFTYMFNKSIGLIRRWDEIKVGLRAA